MPPKNKTRPLSSFLMQVDNQAQKKASKNPNVGSSRGGQCKDSTEPRPQKVQHETPNLVPNSPIKRRRCPRHPRIVTPTISRVEEVLESTQADPNREGHPRVVTPTISRAEELVLESTQADLNRVGHPLVVSPTISRAEEVLESTQVDLNREEHRQVHLTREVLDAHFAEINDDDVATSISSDSTSRKTRGPTQQPAVMPPPGEKWRCLFIDGQAVGKGASKLAIVLGLYARIEGYFPPHKQWREQSSQSFKDVMKDIVKDYDFVDPEGMPANMMIVTRFCKASLQKKLRDWRCWLKTYYYIEGVPEDVLVKAPDKRITQACWESLLKFWENEKKVSEAERNTKNRGEDRATHTLGAKSIARHNQDERMNLGESYTTLGAYLKAHQTKSGEYPDEYTRLLCEKVIQTCDEKGVANSSDPSVLSSILDIVCEGHHGGYERGRGLGWSRALAWSHHMETHTSNESVKQLSVELQIAKTDIEAMRAREREMEERVKTREREMEEREKAREKEMEARNKEMQDWREKMEAFMNMHFSDGRVGNSRLHIGLPTSNPP